MSTPSQIGPFAITRELGRGGMGVVYLGRDTRLDRDVAIKALPPELASDPARLERFEREARTLAGLNHPNIAGIYGVEEQAGVKYLILEYVEGESLADRLDRGPLPADEAVELAVQIAAGMEAAHEAGVIHRDLKPANIIVTPSGGAKVLDFGLARTDEGGSQSSTGVLDGPTMTTPLPQHSPTIAGAILGTAAYMSPEQARGRRVDKRTDIWSFGVVLYEMVTGMGPFVGETATDSIGAVLHRAVDLDRIPASAPSSVRRVIARCLERDKSRRYRDIGDAGLDLLEHSLASETRASRWSPLAVAAGIVAGLVVGSAGYALWGVPESRPEPRPVALSIPVPEGLEITGPIAISPDGSTIAAEFSDENGRSAVYLRDIDEYGFRKVQGSDEGWHPFFSPDSKTLGFFAGDALHIAPVAGGRTTRLVNCSGNVGASWGDDGVIVYSNGEGSPLMRVTASGQQLEPLTSLTGPTPAYAHVWPQHIPGTPYLLFTSWGDFRASITGEGEAPGARILDTRDGNHRPVMEPGARAFAPPVRWSPSGHAIFEAFDDGILALPFDPASGERLPFTNAEQLIGGVAHYGTTTRSYFDIASDGTIAYVPSREQDRRLVWVDAEGQVEEILPESAQQFSSFGSRLDLNKDGTQVLFGVIDVGVVDLRRGLARQLTTQRGNDSQPSWAPGERSIIFNSNREDRWSIWTIGIDGAGDGELLLATENNIGSAEYADDGTLVYLDNKPGGDSDVWIVPPGGEPVAIASSGFDEQQPSITGDGKFVAFTSNAQGQDEIFVIGVGGSSIPVQVTREGGSAARWSPDGTTLYYRRGRSVWKVPMLDGQPAGDPERAFPAERLVTGRTYDIHPDGTRMIAVQIAEDALLDEIRVKTGFFTTIREAIGQN